MNLTIKKKVGIYRMTNDEKRSMAVPMTKIYLATEWFNDEQKERAQKAVEALNANPTVGVIHMPFDFQYKDATIDNDPEGIFGSTVWIQSTFENDIHAMSTSDMCVALINLDKNDPGELMECGFMYAYHKPIYVVPFTEDPDNAEINLMLAGVTTDYINKIEDLSKINFNHPQADFTTPYPTF